MYRLALLLNVLPWVALECLVVWGVVQPDVYWWRLERGVRKDCHIRKIGRDTWRALI